MAIVEEAERASENRVEQAYEELRAMAMMYKFRPGERLNEIELARQLGVSRTPLRQALERLCTEGFLTFNAGRGYYCRKLDPKEIFDLYEMRRAVETAAVVLAVERATDQEIDDLIRFLENTGPDAGDRDTEELVSFDEEFHGSIVSMSRNGEMLRVLRNLNARIKFVRWIDMDRVGRSATQKEHRAIAEALKGRDSAEATKLLGAHIERRLDQITNAIREGLARIYIET